LVKSTAATKNNDFLIISFYHRKKVFAITGGLMKRKHKLLILLAVIIIATLYIFFIEPSLTIAVNRIKINRFNSSDTLKIIQISDLHIDYYYFFHDNILSRVLMEHPDIVIFTGDALTRSSSFGALAEFFSRLSNIAPVYAIYGNWDYYDKEKIDSVYKVCHVNIIEAEQVRLKKKNKTIAFTSLPMYESPGQYYFDKGEYNIFLTHVPANIYKFSSFVDNADLILAGHTHGGQINLPFLTRLLLQSHFSKESFIKGMYNEENYDIYVNSGIGSWFNARLFCPPEITVFEID
jgi:hypothetical protein